MSMEASHPGALALQMPPLWTTACSQTTSPACPHSPWGTEPLGFETQRLFCPGSFSWTDLSSSWRGITAPIQATVSQ